VTSGLRSLGMLTTLAAWWDADMHAIQAIRLTYSRGEQQVVGNRTLALSSPPHSNYTFTDSEYVTGLSMWRSARTADGTAFSPVLSRLELATSTRKLFVAGAELQSSGDVIHLTSHDLGSGLVVGAAAYSSHSAVNAFGLIFLARLPHTEL